jgi:hypothetical protein
MMEAERRITIRKLIEMYATKLLKTFFVSFFDVKNKTLK